MAWILLTGTSRFRWETGHVCSLDTNTSRHSSIPELAYSRIGLAYLNSEAVFLVMCDPSMNKL